MASRSVASCTHAVVVLHLGRGQGSAVNGRFLETTWEVQVVARLALRDLYRVRCLRLVRRGDSPGGDRQPVDVERRGRAVERSGDVVPGVQRRRRVAVDAEHAIATVDPEFPGAVAPEVQR